MSKLNQNRDILNKLFEVGVPTFRESNSCAVFLKSSLVEARILTAIMPSPSGFFNDDLQLYNLFPTDEKFYLVAQLMLAKLQHDDNLTMETMVRTQVHLATLWKSKDCIKEFKQALDKMPTMVEGIFAYAARVAHFCPVCHTVMIAAFSKNHIMVCKSIED